MIVEPTAGGLFYPLITKVLTTVFISVNPATASNVNVAVIVKYNFPIEGGVPVNVRVPGVKVIQLGRGSPLAISAV